MAKIGVDGYVLRKTNSTTPHGCKPSYRDWWLVKHQNGNTGGVAMSNITVPERYVGRRVRFRIELLEEKEIK